MDLFQYTTTIASIDKAKTYSTARSIYSKLIKNLEDNTYTVNFYSIHALNKSIKKFKQLTTSEQINSKNYLLNKTKSYFKQAIKSATTKEQLLLLITDWTEKDDIILYLHIDKDILVTLSSYFNGDEPELNWLMHSIGLSHYSVGVHLLKDSLSVTNRLPINIIRYLKEIKHTNLYAYLLGYFTNMFKLYNSPESIYTKTLATLSNIITDTKKDLEALIEAQKLYIEINPYKDTK